MVLPNIAGACLPAIFFNRTHTDPNTDPNTPIDTRTSSFGAIQQQVSTFRGEIGTIAYLALAFGVGFSVSDVIIDIIMIFEYANNGQTAFSYATLVTVLLTLTLQVLVVMVQNRQRPTLTLLREVFYVIFFSKPGVDLYRVASGHFQQVGTGA